VPQRTGLFRAEYYLTPELQRRIGAERLAVVDEMISQGLVGSAQRCRRIRGGRGIGLSRCGHRTNAAAPTVLHTKQ